MFLLDMDTPGIDIDHVEEALENIIYEGMDLLAEEMEWEIRHLAANDLYDSRDAYLNSLSVDAYEDSIQFQLSHPLATAVESGSEPFDMIPGFLRGTGKPTRLLKLTGRLDKFKNPAGPRKKMVPFSSFKPPWRHPGIKARNFITNTANDVEDIYAPRVFTRLVENLRI